MKYRIVEYKSVAGNLFYQIQFKFLWLFWMNLHDDNYFKYRVVSKDDAISTAKVLSNYKTIPIVQK